MKTSSFKQLSFKGVLSFVTSKGTIKILKTDYDSDQSIKEAFYEAHKYGLESRRGKTSLVSALTLANITKSILIKLKNRGDDLKINIDTSKPDQFCASVNFISSRQNLITFNCKA